MAYEGAGRAREEQDKLRRSVPKTPGHDELRSSARKSLATRRAAHGEPAYGALRPARSRTKERRPHRYVLSIWVRRYEAIGDNRIGLRVNGHVERGLELTGDALLVWELEPNLFHQGINELRFDFQRSRRPSDLVRSADSRPLAVQFYRLELIARGATAESASPLAR